MKRGSKRFDPSRASQVLIPLFLVLLLLALLVTLVLVILAVLGWLPA